MRVTLMLRPSPIIWRMEGTHSGVAGILTRTLGWSIRSWSDRAASMVPCGVVGQRRGHLHRHEAVAAVRGVVDRAEHGQGVVDVVDDQVPVGILDRHGLDQLPELLVVGVLAGDGLGEDGRVGGHPPDALGHQPGQGAVAGASRGAGCRATGSGPAGRRDRESGHRVPFHRAGSRCAGRSRQGRSWTSGRARAEQRGCPGGHVVGGEAEFLQVTSPGADAPKWSMDTVARRSAPSRRRRPPPRPGGARPEGRTSRR